MGVLLDTDERGASDRRSSRRTQGSVVSAAVDTRDRGHDPAFCSLDAAGVPGLLPAGRVSELATCRVQWRGAVSCLAEPVPATAAARALIQSVWSDGSRRR